MELQPIRVSTVNDEVYGRLRWAITTAAPAPGTKVSLRSIADLFEVSTMPRAVAAALAKGHAARPN
jgi:DNA-binding GntR family transcriptional regulator